MGKGVLMGAYQQLGHQSVNLVTEPGLSTYAGIVASPVNYSEVELRTHIEAARADRSGGLIGDDAPFDVVFDPQSMCRDRTAGSCARGSIFPMMSIPRTDPTNGGNRSRLTSPRRQRA